MKDFKFNITIVQILICAIVLLMAFFPSHICAQRKMENLGRGVVAVRSSSNQVLISWRIPVPEYYNNTEYNLYRNNKKIAENLSASNYVDNTNKNEKYSVAPVVSGIERPKSLPVPVTTSFHGSNKVPSLKVPIKKASEYSVGLIYVGDLDSDGEYDFVFIRHPLKTSSTILVDAYKRDGTYLWRYDCGPNSINKNNIEPGSSALGVGHGDNITVYDINNDGKSEVIIRTANGSKFGDGSVLKEKNNTRQFISVLNGLSGKEIGRAPVPTDYISDGPMNGHMGIACLDGKNPSIVWSSKNRIGKGDFNMMVTTYTWKNDSLVFNWKWLRTKRNIPDGHNIRIMDVDGDGKDEIIPFGFCLTPEGKLKYNLGSKGLVHGDRFHVGDLDPSRPNLECYTIQQDNQSKLAWAYFDASNGNILQKQTISKVADLARGCAGDFDPRSKGYEFWTFTDGMYNVSGSRVSNKIPSSYPNMRIWWDGDLLSENLDNKKMTKWDYKNSVEKRLFVFDNITQWWRNVPGFYGDILGDWREEVVYPSEDGSALLIFLTTNPTSERIYTLPHNPGYRNCFTMKGYYQSNMADFYLGQDMERPAKPNITIIGQKSTSVAASNRKTIPNSDLRLQGNELQVNSQLSGFVKMYDLKGKTVFKKQIIGVSRIQLPLGIPRGVYIVEVVCKSSNAHFKTSYAD